MSRVLKRILYFHFLRHRALFSENEKTKVSLVAPEKATKKTVSNQVADDYYEIPNKRRVPNKHEPRKFLVNSKLILLKHDLNKSVSLEKLKGEK